VIRFVRQGFTPHIHINGASEKGLVLSFVAGTVGLLFRRRPFLTFHAGVEHVLFPRSKAPLWAPVFRLLFIMPRTIICNSEEVKAKIVEYGISPGKIAPIPAFSRQYLEDMADTLPLHVESFFERYRNIVFCYIRLRPLFYPVEVVQGFAALASRGADAGLVLCGVSGHMEGDLLPKVHVEIERNGIGDRVLILDDLPHPVFLAALSRSSIYLRSHLSDGVCSSVLESLSLGVPVVASENGTRPPGVQCYPATDPEALGALLHDVIARGRSATPGSHVPDAGDTLRTEVDLLTGTT
jgi:glycosyltransferase involved in cell wall biosynthesis